MIEAVCYTNLDEAELFLNGRSLGDKPVMRHGYAAWRVPSEPGRIEARARRGRQELHY